MLHQETPRTGHAVVIASTGRPCILLETLVSVAAQDPPPDEVVVAIASKGDVPEGWVPPPSVRVIYARPGSSSQRNDGESALSPDISVVTFLDDDVELTPDYLRQVRGLMASEPDVVLVGGNLLANGGIDRAAARKLVLEAAATPPGGKVEPMRNAYGCNLTARRDVLAKVRFDERLRGYGWLEDTDFGVQCGKHGRRVTFEGARLVHIGVSSGRVSGRKLGFAQMMNPWYLARKGSLPWRELWFHHWLPVVRNNVVKWLLRDRAVDRAGRLRGNLAAIGMILRGQCEPEHVERLK